MSALFELNLVSLFTGGILYGHYLATTISCLRWLVFDDEGLYVRNKLSWKMLSTTIFLFILMTAATGINFQLTIRPTVLANSLVTDKLNVASVRVFSNRINKLRLD